MAGHGHGDRVGDGFGSYDAGQLILEDPQTVQGDRMSRIAYAVRRE